jgi:hypothetical protein
MAVCAATVAGNHRLAARRAVAAAQRPRNGAFVMPGCRPYCVAAALRPWSWAQPFSREAACMRAMTLIWNIFNYRIPAALIQIKVRARSAH